MSDRWKISRLKEHPKQAELFGDASEQKLQDLADSLEHDGQQQLVDVLPDGTLVDGHQRVRAAKKNGWTHIDVNILYDLADAGEEAVEKRMIETNLLRRQLDTLETARLYRRLKEIERSKPYDDLQHADREELRDRVARGLGSRSGRTLDRYERLLNTPRAVQNAFTKKELSIQLALEVTKLREPLQADIARRIAAGENAKAVVREFIVPTSSASPTPTKAYRKVLSLLDKHLTELSSNLDSIAGTVWSPERTLAVLGRAEEFISQVAQQERRVAAEQEQALDEFIEDFDE